MCNAYDIGEKLRPGHRAAWDRLLRERFRELPKTGTIRKTDAGLVVARRESGDLVPEIMRWGFSRSLNPCINNARAEKDCRRRLDVVFRLDGEETLPDRGRGVFTNGRAPRATSRRTGFGRRMWTRTSGCGWQAYGSLQWISAPVSRWSRQRRAERWQRSTTGCRSSWPPIRLSDTLNPRVRSSFSRPTREEWKPKSAGAL